MLPSPPVPSRHRLLHWTGGGLKLPPPPGHVTRRPNWRGVGRGLRVQLRAWPVYGRARRSGTCRLPATLAMPVVARGEPGIVRVPAATGLAAGARQFAKENGLEQTGDGMPSTLRSTVLDALALRMLVVQANSIQAAG